MTQFDGFVMFAEMRTGSNFLEESINLFPKLTCHGEAFNPTFVGRQNWSDLFGMDTKARDADPLELMRRIFERTDGLGGFRFFHDHDPRVLEAVLPNPRIAKIILTRNPLDAYVSRKIATTTGQWLLTDARHRKSARIVFDPREFEAEVAQKAAFQAKLKRKMQTTGQAPFHMLYEETRQLDVVNGLATFLGEAHTLPALSDRLKRQNPAPLSDKVENYGEMQSALSEMNLNGLTHASTEEVRNSPAVPTFVAAPKSAALFMPIKGGPTEAIATWLAALDESPQDDLQRGFTQKTLRQWKNRNKRGRSFTVVSHPTLRAYRVFRAHILTTGPGCFAAIRAHLREADGLPIPETTPDHTYSARDQRDAFLGFVEFLGRNLSGATHLRTDPAFVPQSSSVAAVCEIFPPDMVLREDQLELGLRQLCQQIKKAKSPPVAENPSETEALEQIYDADVESAVRSVYNRDYMTFGFRPWKTEG